MDKLGIKKIPGISHIELNGEIHTFIMRDSSHPEYDEILKQLLEMHQEYPIV
jgi:hypothetical protein